MRRLYHPEKEQIALTLVLQALADLHRLAIVKILAEGGESNCSLMRLDIAKSTISHHFKVLRESGVTKTRTQGTHKLVSLRRDDLEERFPGLLKVILEATEPL